VTEARPFFSGTAQTLADSPPARLRQRCTGGSLTPVDKGAAAPSPVPGPGDKVAAYTYPSKRKNNPPAGLAAQGTFCETPRLRYEYNPHLPPVLRFGPAGTDALPELLATARQRPLTDAEAKLLADALRRHEPWLEWSGKREKPWFEVEPVALHIHERISTQAILRVLAREDVQRDLFADPQQEYAKAVQFYQHDVDWSNRMILGDSLQVMASLARREDLAGKVQMSYIDPPYGISFKSNFQPSLGQRDVKDREQDLTREPEMVKAYRDTWTLGVHSYLAYLRDRLAMAKELLADTGSIFVQISDENLHRVRCVMDEVFGVSNCIGLVIFRTTGGQATTALAQPNDFLLWYSKDRDRMRYNQLYVDKCETREGNRFAWGQSPCTGEIADLDGAGLSAADNWRLLVHDNITSQGTTTGSSSPFGWRGEGFQLPKNSHWKTNPEGMLRLAEADRLMVIGATLRFKRFLGDFPVAPLHADWDDTALSGFGRKKEALPGFVWVMSRQPGVQVQSAAMEEYCGAQTLLAAEAEGVALDLLDLAVEAFGTGVGDAVHDGVEHSLPVVADGVSRLAHRFQPGMGCPPEPLPEECLGGLARAAAPQFAQVLLDGPGPPRPDRLPAQFLEAFHPVHRHVLMVVQEQEAGTEEAAALLLVLHLLLLGLPDFVDGPVHGHGHVEVVEADVRLGHGLGYHRGIAGTHVHGHGLHPPEGVLAFGEPGLDRFDAALVHHIEHAAPVQIGDDGGVLVALEHGLLVDAQPPGHRRAAPRHSAFHRSPHQPVDLVPGEPGQAGRSLSAALLQRLDAPPLHGHGQPRRTVRQRRPDLQRAILRTGHARKCRMQPGLVLAGVQMPPGALGRVVVDRQRRAAGRAGEDPSRGMLEPHVDTLPGIVHLHTAHPPGHRRPDQTLVERCQIHPVTPCAVVVLDPSRAPARMGLIARRSRGAAGATFREAPCRSNIKLQ
jgi:hypothetical protein